MNEITMYGTQSCGYCHSAELLLSSKGVTRLNKIYVDAESGQMERMIARTGRRTVPQVFIGNLHVGGFDDLVRLDKAGRLDKLLSGK